MTKRIIGIDVARALAVAGMIIVNFNIVIGSKGDGLARSFMSLFEGKAAATFVVLAGVGLALLSKKAVDQEDLTKIKQARVRILKRAAFLFIVGISYIVIWPADILHFYGVYMLFVIVLLRSKQSSILISALLLIFLYPFLLFIIEYETGWDFETFSYIDFWSPIGFFRNLFYNGFHPVIPWSAFMLVGFWFGKFNLNDDKLIKKIMISGIAIFMIMQIISYSLINSLSGGDEAAETELSFILETSPMPPFPIYMISGSCIALFIISGCILLAKKFEESWLIKALNQMGQLALTFYVAHVVIGMGLMELISPEEMGTYTANFSLAYAITFSIACLLFAVIWKRKWKSGPLEFLMRKLTD